MTGTVQTVGAVAGTPLPRLALRIGLTGHRPGRLNRSLDSINRDRAARGEAPWTFRAFEDNLAARIEAALLAIEHDVIPLASSASVLTSHGVPQRLFRNEPPQLRLVCGAALGVDALGAAVVSQRLQPAGAVPRPAEWRVDQLLPAGRTSFVLDAAQDTADLANLPGGPVADVGAIWQAIFACGDARVSLPASWRAAGGPSPMLAEAPLAPGLTERFGPPDEQPAPVNGRGFTLDHVQTAEFLLRQIDVLVAVWDGEPAAGPGGTADIVARAYEAGLPVFVIETDRPEAPLRCVLSVTRAEGRADVVGWYARPVSAKLADGDASGKDLQAALEAALGVPRREHTHPPGERHGHGDARSDSEKLGDFLAERWPVVEGPKGYTLFVAAFRGAWGQAATLLHPRRWFRSGASDVPHWSDGEWSGFIRQLPDGGNFSRRLKDILHRRFVAADELAVYYADTYRDAFVKCYLLAALAVVVAIVSLVVSVPREAALPVKGALVLLELYFIGKIAWKIRSGEHGSWHSKFVDYRALAESLRHMRFLAAFAEYAPGGGQALAPQAWWAWYLRATARELGLPHDVQFDAHYQASVLRALRSAEIEPQIRYNATTHSRMGQTEHGIHAVGNAMFWITMAVLGITALLIGGGLVASALEAGRLPVSLEDAGEMMMTHEPRLFAGLYAGKTAIGVLAAILPALGAALTGIRFTADFDGKAARSSAMVQDLAALSKQIEVAEARPDFNLTRERLGDAAGILSEDVSAFLALYGRKQLTVPG